MIVLLARLVARIVGVALLVVLAAGGLAAAIFCIQGGHETLSLPALAHDIHLPELRAQVGTFLRRLQSHGPVAVVSALAGAGAIVLGLMLLTGALVPVRERLVIIAREGDGVISARRRALGGALAALAEQPAAVLRARARVRPWRRRRGGTGRLRVEHADTVASDEVKGMVQEALGALTDAVPLRTRIRVRPRERRVL